MDPYAAGALSILPPMIAVALALLTKEVLSALLIGILSGTFIYCVGSDYSGNVLIGTAEIAFKEMVVKFDLNIVMFCSILGALVYVISMAGGAKAYGLWATTRIKNRRSAMLSTSIFGTFIFIDDYFNCLTVGTVMRPITDSYKISRAKLAYIIDSIAAPICIITPISSWAAAVGSNLKDTKVFDNEMSAFIATVPWNFYAILSISLVFLLSLLQLDFGPMYKAEQDVLNDKDATQESSSTNNTDVFKTYAHGTMWDMILPIVALIIFCILSLLYMGGYFGADEAYHTIGAAFGNADAGPSLVLGSFGGLLVAFVMFVTRKLLSIKEFMEGVQRGVKAMVPACMILTLAWTISGVCRDLLQTPEFISTLFGDEGSSAQSILPALIFTVAGFLSFSTGTAWGTFGILIPIVVTVAQAIDPNSQELVVISLSATLAGSVFGDHCSPISDTTVLSSAGSGCIHIDHVYTQLPYALLVAGCSFFGYVIAGISYNLYFSFGSAMTLMIAILFLMHRRTNKASNSASS